MHSPDFLGASEKPNPGIDTQTTWKLSVSVPAASKGISLKNSTIEPGQPWVIKIGLAWNVFVD